MFFYHRMEPSAALAVRTRLAPRIQSTRDGDDEQQKKSQQGVESQLTARTICRLSERSALGRSASWVKQKSRRRSLSEVYLQFDYDNEGFLSLGKVLALFSRYSPETPTGEVEAIFQRHSKNDRLEYQHFVRLVDHEQQRGRFTECFESSVLSMDLMFETEQLWRSLDLRRLLAKISPQHLSGDELTDRKADVDLRMTGDSTRDLFRGIRTSVPVNHDVGHTLLTAVQQHTKRAQAEARADDDPKATKLPPIRAVAPPNDHPSQHLRPKASAATRRPKTSKRQIRSRDAGR